MEISLFTPNGSENGLPQASLKSVKKFPRSLQKISPCIPTARIQSCPKAIISKGVKIIFRPTSTSLGQRTRWFSL